MKIMCTLHCLTKKNKDEITERNTITVEKFNSLHSNRDKLIDQLNYKIEKYGRF